MIKLKRVAITLFCTLCIWFTIWKITIEMQPINWQYLPVTLATVLALMTAYLVWLCTHPFEDIDKKK